MKRMLCRKTLQTCPTPGVCAPHGGCQSETGHLLAGEHRRTTAGHAADVWPDSMEVVPADDLDALQRRCSNLETVQQASMERSGRIKAAAGALGWTADREDGLLDFLIGQAQRCRELENEKARVRDHSQYVAEAGAALTSVREALGLPLGDSLLTDLVPAIDALHAEVEALRKDKDLLDAIEANCWDVRFSSSPNADAGDSSISIEIVGHYMAEPHERVVGENYHENLRAALCQAMTADDYPPARPEYDEDEAIDAAMEVAP